MIGHLTDYRDVYVAACGVVFASRYAGILHERQCAECQRETNPEDSDLDQQEGSKS